jgi:hypothetical protein
MYDTIEEVYERYLGECKKHSAWLKERHSTKLKCFLWELGTKDQLYNHKWIKALELVEIVLNLSEEEKQEHTL